MSTESPKLKQSQVTKLPSLKENGAISPEPIKLKSVTIRPNSVMRNQKERHEVEPQRCLKTEEPIERKMEPLKLK